MAYRRKTAAVVILAATLPLAAQQAGLPRSDPSAIGLDPAQLRYIDDAVLQAIRRKEVPGAVVLVARHGKIGYFKAIGHRALRPEPEAMTEDTIFDMASLTKVLATAPAIMLLAQRGALRLGDRVRSYLPRFTGGGKDSITVRQLLAHHSGLRPDFDLSRRWQGYEAAMEELWHETTEAEPGSKFSYSDLNFIALGEIVRVVSGKSLDAFVRDEIYMPLGMTDTGFNPPEAWRLRIAPTESRARSLAYLKGESADPLADTILRGQVHDPTAWRMDGVAGHAGLFSSARDVAIFAQTLLNQGTYGKTRVFMPMVVQAMTGRQSPPESPSARGFGWDIDTAYSVPRGDFFAGGFGHTGFTGTSLWVHPPTDTFVVILSNRVHPDGSGDATRLRGIIANIVAAAIVD